MNKTKKILLAVLAVLLIVLGILYILNIGVLYPSQVDSSMVDAVIKVKGKITYTLENPAGMGGIFLTLSDNDGDVEVRIQDDVWQSFDEDMKDKYTMGNIVVVEGILFCTREANIIIYGKYHLSSNTTSK